MVVLSCQLSLSTFHGTVNFWQVAALHALGREKEAGNKYAAIIAEDPNLAGQTLEQVVSPQAILSANTFNL